MEKIIFFDTETTHFSKWAGNKQRIIQFAWDLVDFKTGEVLRSESILIKPDGWEVPSVSMFRRQGMDQISAEKSAMFWVEHGFSQEKNIQYGRPMPDVLDFFINDIEESQLIVAHNIDFDVRITSFEMIHYGRRSQNKPARFCTMKASTDLCKLPYPSGRKGIKKPSMEELHRFLFNRSFTGSHDAGNDVAACRVCFFELLKRNLIKF